MEDYPINDNLFAENEEEDNNDDNLMETSTTGKMRRKNMRIATNWG